MLNDLGCMVRGLVEDRSNCLTGAVSPFLTIRRWIKRKFSLPLR
jgi:hypothetical protein